MAVQTAVADSGASHQPSLTHESVLPCTHGVLVSNIPHTDQDMACPWCITAYYAEQDYQDILLVFLTISFYTYWLLAPQHVVHWQQRPGMALHTCTHAHAQTYISTYIRAHRGRQTIKQLLNTIYGQQCKWQWLFPHDQALLLIAWLREASAA